MPFLSHTHHANICDSSRCNMEMCWLNRGVVAESCIFSKTQARTMLTPSLINPRPGQGAGAGAGAGGAEIDDLLAPAPAVDPVHPPQTKMAGSFSIFLFSQQLGPPRSSPLSLRTRKGHDMENHLLFCNKQPTKGGRDEIRRLASWPLIIPPSPAIRRWSKPMWLGVDRPRIHLCALTRGLAHEPHVQHGARSLDLFAGKGEEKGNRTPSSPDRFRSGTVTEQNRDHESVKFQCVGIRAMLHPLDSFTFTMK